jgi:hypothetical protein
VERGWNAAFKVAVEWQDAAKAAEAEVARLRKPLADALSMCQRYADFIVTCVKADDIEMHPYLPELEQVVENLRALSSSEHT